VKLFLAGEMIEVEGREVNVKLNLCTRIDEDNHIRPQIDPQSDFNALRDDSHQTEFDPKRN